MIKGGNNPEHFPHLARDSIYMEQNIDRLQGKIAKSMVTVRDMKP